MNKQYYKVLKTNLTSIGLRRCIPIQYILGEWCFMNPPEKIYFAHQSKGETDLNNDKLIA